MTLTIKNADGTYSEIAHVAGHGIVGVAIVAVRFNYKDCGDQLALLNEIQHSILPRMVIPAESDFLPEEIARGMFRPYPVDGSAAYGLDYFFPLDDQGNEIPLKDLPRPIENHTRWGATSFGKRLPQVFSTWREAQKAIYLAAEDVIVADAGS